MKKCLILFAVFIATLVVSILFERTESQMPENTLVVSEVHAENWEFPDSSKE